MKNKSNDLLADFFGSCQNGLRSAKSVSQRKALHEFDLDENRIKVGYNSGQFHHGKSDEFKKQFIEQGILTLSDAPVNKEDRTSYTCFGKEALIFPLYNGDNEIVNLFAYRIKVSTNKKLYLNDKGVYPGYPKSHTKRLIFTYDVIDAATTISTEVLEFDEAVIALNEGELTEEHIRAVLYAEDLEEITWINNYGEAFTQKLNGYVNQILNY